MQSDSESLYLRRIKLLLNNSHFFWLSSILLGSLCALSQLLYGSTVLYGLSNAAILIASTLGLWINRFSRQKILIDPLWSPYLQIMALVTVNAIAWGLLAQNSGLYLTLAIAQSGMAGTFLVSHGRLVGLSIGIIALLPIPALYFTDNTVLNQVHLPLMAFILLASVQGHRLVIRYIRKELESDRLNQLLTQNQVELQQQIAKRTTEIEKTNHRLNREIDLRKELNEALILSEEQLSLALSASEIGFWDWDIAHRKTFHSNIDTFFQTDDSDEDFSLSDHVDPQDFPSIKKAMRQHLKGKSDDYQVRYRVALPPNTQPIWLEDTGRVIERDPLGRATRMIGTRRNVTNDMKLQEELSLSASFFNNSSEGVFLLDAQQNIKTCNRIFCQLLGRQKGELEGLPLFNVFRTEQAQQISRVLLSNGRWDDDIVIERNDNNRLPITLTLTAIRRDDGSISHFLGICRDRSEHHQSQQEISFLHNYDKLTRLYNRTHFHKILKQFSEHKPLHKNHYAVCVLNLDRFKSINESLGFDVGDRLLKDLAARLNHFSEPVQQVTRLASDEFAFIIEYHQQQEKLEQVLTLLQTEITRPFLVEDHELIVTASIGVCIVSEHNLMHLLNEATTAMNQARYQGGNNFQFYHKKLASTPLEQMQLEKSIRKAIINHEFSVDYQPKLNLNTGMIDSVEALVRWMHPQMGVVSPSDFIPLAEETGLISAIGRQVLFKACEDAATWRARGLGDIFISVNLSSHQIRRNDLLEVIQEALLTSGLPPEYLELEITESMLMEDFSHAQDFLSQFKSMGVKLALDDFGTGYSSLNYLKRLPIDTLKIDKSFMAETRQGNSSPIVEAIMAMSASLKLAVVAEGVETQDQLTYVKNLGCDYAQGYLISRALPASEVLSLIRHTNLHSLTDTDHSVH